MAYVRMHVVVSSIVLLLISSATAMARVDARSSLDLFAAQRIQLGRGSGIGLDFKLASIRPQVSHFGLASEPNAGTPSPRSSNEALPSANEPFGYHTMLAPPGALWTKWTTVQAGMSAERPALMHCRADPHRCSPSVARFTAIVNEAAEQHGRARLAVVNEKINAAIAYSASMASSKGAHTWSAPLAPNRKGAFMTGRGDCKDYAIAKYVALREAGTSARDLQLLVVRDTSVNDYHAVVAVRDDNGRWLLLDNRWSHLTEANEASYFVPLFALGAEGVKRFAKRVEAPGSAKRAAAGTAPVVPASMADAPLLTSTLQNSSQLGTS